MVMMTMTFIGKDLFHWATPEKTVLRKSCEDHLQGHLQGLNQGTCRNGDTALLSQTGVRRAAVTFHVARVFTTPCPCEFFFVLSL